MQLLSTLSVDRLGITELAGKPVQSGVTTAPGDKAPIGGLKLAAEDGWCAVRPSGTEDVYKIYAESFRSEAALRQIEQEVQDAIATVFDVMEKSGTSPKPSG
jgi:phosphoglucomutase